jgi:predicted DNA-binding transcriptional regulator AlpA
MGASVSVPPAGLLDVRAVAERLNCSTRHVWRLRDSGAMPPPVELGSLVRWSSQSIETWIGKGCPPHRQRGGRT